MSSYYGSFITACNRDPSIIEKSGAQNLPYISFKVNNDLGYDFDFKIVSTLLHQSIDKFSSTASFSVPRGTILQLINKDTKTIRQIVAFNNGQEFSAIKISQIPICTTIPVCGTPVFAQKETPGFGIGTGWVRLDSLDHSDFTTRLEVLSFGAYDEGKSYGNYWKIVPSQNSYFSFDFSISEIYRIGKLTFVWPGHQVSDQRQFSLLEPGIYNSIDIFESLNCTSRGTNWGIPSSNQVKAPGVNNSIVSNSGANPQITFTIDRNASAADWATSGFAILLYAILLFALVKMLTLYKKGSPTKKAYDSKVVAISKAKRTEKYELLEEQG